MDTGTLADMCSQSRDSASRTASVGLAVLCWENEVLHVDKEVLPVDKAVPSLQATLVDKTDAFLEVLLASRKKRTSK